MKGLIIKDILNLKKSLKTTLFMALFFLAFAYGTKSPPYAIGMFTVLFSMMSITSMSYDESTNWDRYALSMPISRRSVVASKYILSLGFALIAAIISFGISYVFILPKSDISLLELFLVTYMVFSVAIIYASLLFPFIYKLGVERSRIISLAVFAMPVIAIIIPFKAGVKAPSVELLVLMLKLSPLIILMILVSSYFLSLKIYKNKEL